MRSDEEIILKVSKEIVIKFIETGRMSISSFEEGFTKIHEVVKNCFEQPKK
jgi:hypothetical protein